MMQLVSSPHLVFVIIDSIRLKFSNPARFYPKRAFEDTAQTSTML